MKIKVTDKILNYEDKPIKASANSEEDTTWRLVFFIALNNFARDEVPTAELKSQCYQLTQKVYKTNEPDLTPNERTLLKERVQKAYVNPLICGRVEEILFPEDKPKDESSDKPVN